MSAERPDVPAPAADALLAAGVAVAFAPAAAGLAAAWAAAAHQSHGFLVAVVSVWWAASMRARLARLPRRRDAHGARVLAAALALYAAGLLAGSISAQGAALVLATVGLVWWLRGPAWLRTLAFPLAFLIFLVPLPAAWITPLTVRLLAWVSWAAEAVLRAGGTAVTREGNVLSLANGESLFIAEACSGLTSLLTLIPIAVLVAQLMLSRAAARALLVALVVPLAMAANLVRIVATAVAASHLGARAVTDEPWHALAGLGVYAVACLGLLAAAWRLRPQSARAVS